LGHDVAGGDFGQVVTESAERKNVGHKSPFFPRRSCFGSSLGKPILAVIKRKPE
jgi:hypothetical protein